jgi:hypothetical protein
VWLLALVDLGAQPRDDAAIGRAERQFRQRALRVRAEVGSIQPPVEQRIDAQPADGLPEIGARAGLPRAGFAGTLVAEALARDLQLERLGQDAARARRERRRRRRVRIEAAAATTRDEKPRLIPRRLRCHDSRRPATGTLANLIYSPAASRIGFS